jgi:predicted ester cyclase
MTTTQANAAVVARLWEEAFNAGSVDVLPELVSEEFVNFGAVTDGPQFLTALIREQRTAFPDMRFTPTQVIAADDWVLTKTRWTGTFTAPCSHLGLAGVEPTGRSFDVQHVHAFRLADGKVVEHWAVRDDLTMHHQLLQPGNQG